MLGASNLTDGGSKSSTFGGEVVLALFFILTPLPSFLTYIYCMFLSHLQLPSLLELADKNQNGQNNGRSLLCGTCQRIEEHHSVVSQ